MSSSDSGRASGSARAAARRSSSVMASKRLQSIAGRINHDLLVKQNAVLAYAGTSYGAGMFALQPPEIAKQLLEGHPARGGQPGPYALLEPAARNGPRGSMQVTAVVVGRQGAAR